MINQRYPAENVDNMSSSEAQNLLLASLLQEEIGVSSYGHEVDPENDPSEEQNFIEKEVEINKTGVSSIDLKGYIFSNITAHWRNKSNSQTDVALLADLKNSNSILEADTINANDSVSFNVDKFISGRKLLVYSDSTEVELLLYLNKA